MCPDSMALLFCRLRREREEKEFEAMGMDNNYWKGSWRYGDRIYVQGVNNESFIIE